MEADSNFYSIAYIVYVCVVCSIFIKSTDSRAHAYIFCSFSFFNNFHINCTDINIDIAMCSLLSAVHLHFSRLFLFKRAYFRIKCWRILLMLLGFDLHTTMLSFIVIVVLRSTARLTFNKM